MSTEKRYQIIVEMEQQIRGVAFRAELWLKPYTGRMVACTEWRMSKRTAQRDGRRFLRLPQEPA